MTDHYQQCESALLTKVRGLTDYFAKDWQVSDDIGVLGKGAAYFFIVLPGTFPTARANGREKDVVWNVTADLYVRYTEQKDSLARLKAVRSALFNHLHADPWLNKTPGVSDVQLSAAGQVVQDVPGDNPNYIIQTLNVAIKQRVTVL